MHMLTKLAVWPLHWLISMPNALSGSYISPTQFPKTFAYIARFDAAVKAARSVAPKQVKVSGPQVVGLLSAAPYHDSVIGEFDANDPFGFSPGDIVTVHPTDSGFTCKDTGKLVALTPDEVVLEKQTKIGDFTVRVHFPRWGFRMSRANGKL
jgi:hypothetical protein